MGITNRDVLKTKLTKGEQMHQLMADLYPICRSITGDGVREILNIVKTTHPLTALPDKVMGPSKSFPRISIGVPTYNGGHRIRKAFDSILQQNYPNLELIIGDNCSDDNTEELCLALAREHPDMDIRYFRHKENLGLLQNFEFTLNQATGAYFMWVADDDLLEPAVLVKYAEFFGNNPDYAIISGMIMYWGDNNVTFNEQLTLEQKNPLSRVIAYYSKVRWTGMTHGIMRRELAQRVPIRKVLGSDYHFVASMAFLGKMKTLDFVGYHKWLGGSSHYPKKTVRLLGESDWVANFPRLKLAYDALLEPYRSPVYSRIPVFSRLCLAVLSAMFVLCNYYIDIGIQALGNKIKKRFPSTLMQLPASGSAGKRGV